MNKLLTEQELIDLVIDIQDYKLSTLEAVETIQSQKLAHGEMVIGDDEVEDIDLSKGAKSRWGVRARNRVRAEQRERNV